MSKRTDGPCPIAPGQRSVAPPIAAALPRVGNRWRRTLALTALIIALIPIVAAMAFPPLRRIAPGLYGLSCRSHVCAEDLAALPAAENLYREAVVFVGRKVIPLAEPRQVIFCRTDRCSQHFGLSGRRVGQTTGPFGSVIGPRGWAAHTVRHELIHQIQNQALGMYRLRPGPDWFIEGMAYAWSDDPREDLGAPWQAYRREFLIWCATTPRQEFWDRAAELW